MSQSSGATGIQSLDAVESALTQPRMTFAGEELYPTVVETAPALEFSLIQNRPFVDGKKRVGHAEMETFMVLNGYLLFLLRFNLMRGPLPSTIKDPAISASRFPMEELSPCRQICSFDEDWRKSNGRCVYCQWYYVSGIGGSTN